MNVLAIQWKDAEYQDLLQRDGDAFLYHSPFWLHLLEKTLQIPIHVLGCSQDGRLVAALPYAISNEGALGPVINSLPFFGSIGGLVHGEDVTEAEPALRMLTEALLEEAHRLNAASLTVIDRPQDPLDAMYRHSLNPTFTDSRVTYFLTLSAPPPSTTSGERLLSHFAGRTRTAIRKAQKQRYTIERSRLAEDFDQFFQIHQENMRATGGIAKPVHFMKTTFEELDDERVELWIAKKEGQMAAGALFFFYCGTAEYYMTALEAKHRSFQPLSLILFEAMQSFIRRGVKRLNLGGTWPNQDGLKQFKSSWGTTAATYHYYIRILKKDLVRCDAQQLVEAYPFFYTIPFQCLAQTLERDLDRAAAL